MPEISQQLVERLDSITASLLALVGELKAAEVDTPEELRAEVAEKVARRECLVCGTVNPKRYVRGNCGNCEQNIRNAVRRGDITEAELIRAGKMLPQRKGGRQAKSPLPIAEILDQLRTPRTLATSLADYVQDNNDSIGPDPDDSGQMPGQATPPPSAKKGAPRKKRKPT